MKIFDLQTEGLEEPIGIDTKTPSFSWKIGGKGSFQTWYRILVASSAGNLEEGRYDLWDSGRVPSSRSFGVRYAGDELRSKTVYYWRVATDAGQSEIASFETAYLDRPMPDSVWIGMPMAFQGATDVVRLDFEVTKEVRRARFYVAALGCCRCYLNEKLADDTYFDGGISVYHRSVFYRTRPLSVRQGTNSLCVELGYGFYGAKKLIGEVWIEYADGTVSTLPTIAGRVWNVTRGPVTQNSLYGGEKYDGRVDLKGILSGEMTTDRFVAAYCVDPPAGELKANPIPPMRIAERWEPVSVRTCPDGSVLLDAGKNVTGWIRMRVRGQRGARAVAEYAEVLDGEGNMSRVNLRTAESRDTYILAGEGEEVYAPAFTYHGFRYVRVWMRGEARLIGAEVQHLRTAVRPCGRFSCSDPILNRLHEIAVQTESNNLNGIFTDCPQRDERLGWLNDLSSRIYESVCNFDLQTFLPHFVNMITDSQQDSGAIGDTVPFTVGSTVADGVDAYQLLGWIAYRLYGDSRVLEENYTGFCRWYQYLCRFKRDGIVEWGLYGDWCPALAFSKGGDGTQSALVPPVFLSGAYAIWNAGMLADIAEILGKEEDAAAWRAERERSKRAFFKKYLSLDGRIGGQSQTECAVAMTVFPEERELCRGWAEAAAKDLRAREYHMTCGNQGYRHLLYRLAEHGFADELIRLLRNDEYPGWGYMLRSGATTVWERWESDVFSDMHSFDHPMFVAYDGFFYNYLAGIRMDECEDAFARIVVEPCFAKDVGQVEAEYRTVRGLISVEWRSEGAKYILRIETPGNTRLTVRSRGRSLRCGGRTGAGELCLENGAFYIEIEESIENDEKNYGFHSRPVPVDERSGMYAKGESRGPGQRESTG